MDPPPRDKLGGDPIELAGLFEGDIRGVSPLDIKTKSIKSIGDKGKPQIQVMHVLKLILTK